MPCASARAKEPVSDPAPSAKAATGHAVSNNQTDGTKEQLRARSHGLPPGEPPLSSPSEQRIGRLRVRKPAAEYSVTIVNPAGSCSQSRDLGYFR